MITGEGKQTGRQSITLFQFADTSTSASFGVGLARDHPRLSLQVCELVGSFRLLNPPGEATVIEGGAFDQVSSHLEVLLERKPKQLSTLLKDAFGL